MKLFKFLVADDRFYPIPDAPGASARGCLAVALAEDAATARAIIEEAGATLGHDTRWLSVATISEIPIDKPRIVAVAM
jgi:hypothetical protein